MDDNILVIGIAGGTGSVKPTRKQVAVQLRHTDGIHLVFKGGLVLPQHSLLFFAVARPVYFGEIPVGDGVQVADRLRKMLGPKGKSIRHRAGVPAGFQLPAQGCRRGIVSAAGIAGQDENFHVVSAPFLWQRRSRAHSRGRLYRWMIIHGM